MRHNNSGKKLSRTPSHRKALFANMTKALLAYGKIRTTEVKAKELRRQVEPLITLALRNDLHSRRLAFAMLGEHSVVKNLFDNVAPLFKGVNGGYSRITRLALPRKGDCAPMVVIELPKLLEARAATEAPKAE